MEPLVLCIEGTKGAGKTTTIEKLAQNLAMHGIEVVICAPFTAANEFACARGLSSAVEMIASSPANNREEIGFILGTMKEATRCAQEKAEEGKKIALIYDRGWMTVLPHLFGGAWRKESAQSEAEVSALWQKVLQDAPLTFFLYAPFEIIKQRRGKLDITSGLETDEKLRDDIEGRIAFAARHADKIVMSFNTGLTQQTTVVNAIADYITTHFAATCARPKPSQACADVSAALII